MFDDFFNKDISRRTVRVPILSTMGKPREDKTHKSNVKAAPTPNPAIKINKFRQFRGLPAEIQILIYSTPHY